MCALQFGGKPIKISELDFLATCARFISSNWWTIHGLIGELAIGFPDAIGKSDVLELDVLEQFEKQVDDRDLLENLVAFREELIETLRIQKSIFQALADLFNLSPIRTRSDRKRLHREIMRRAELDVSSGNAISWINHTAFLAQVDDALIRQGNLW